MSTKCEELPIILSEARDICLLENQLKANAEFGRIIVSNQLNTYDVLKNTRNAKKIKLYWNDVCDVETLDCEDLCTVPDADEVSTDCQEYEITKRKEVKAFRIPVYAYKHTAGDRQADIAREAAKRLNALDEFVAQELLNFVHLNTGTPVANSITPYTLANGQIFVPVQDWNADLFKYFTKFVIRNKLCNPYLIDGENLFSSIITPAQCQSECEQALFGTLPYNYDLFNPALNPETENSTFLIEKSALAFASVACYDSVAPIEIKSDKFVYSVDSPIHPGVKYDVIKDVVCEGNDVYEQWRFQLHYDIFLNPTGCNGDNNGIYEFTCGTAPVTP